MQLLTVILVILWNYNIRFDVVLAYLPKKADPFYASVSSVFPEGIERVPFRFAIEYRNKWMIENSDIVVTYVRHSYGGAAKFQKMAQRKGKQIIEL